jgi:hypothetical protein
VNQRHPHLLEIVTQHFDVARIYARNNIAGLGIVIGSVIESLGGVFVTEVAGLAGNASQPLLRFVELFQPAAMAEVKLPVSVKQVGVLRAEDPIERTCAARGEPFVNKPLKTIEGRHGILFGLRDPHTPVNSRASLGESPSRDQPIPRIARDRKPRQRADVFWRRIEQIDQGEMANKLAKQHIGHAGSAGARNVDESNAGRSERITSTPYPQKIQYFFRSSRNDRFAQFCRHRRQIKFTNT